MSVFVDTNVILRSIEPGDPSHAPAVRAITALMKTGEPVVITPQIVAEFWNVATRPRERNGIGLTTEQAQAELDEIESFFDVVLESRDVYREWKQLVTFYKVRGVEAHDARLVAAMKVDGISRILTFNTKDFVRYGDIEALHLNSIEQGTI